MNIPPYLERLLLSNEAVFKNASLGLSGQNFVSVPKGKTAVILEIDVQPFCNLINAQELFQGDFVLLSDALAASLKRYMFQIQIINDCYSTHLNYNNEFSFTPVTVDIGERQGIYSAVQMNFAGKKDELFIYTDRGMYFNFLYPYLEAQTYVAATGLSISYDPPTSANFIPVEQNLPKEPVTFNGSNFQNWVKVVLSNPIGNSTRFYSPTNRNTTVPIELQNALSEYFRLAATNDGYNPNPAISIAMPVGSGEQINFYNLPQLPLMNVKYALLNKRPADYGITAPTK